VVKSFVFEASSNSSLPWKEKTSLPSESRRATMPTFAPRT
jgi:hypothetical protein